MIINQWIYLSLKLVSVALCFVGTIISGLAVTCVGTPRIPSKEDHVVVTMCVNVWVGVAQLFTVTFLLVGWFWSMAWGFLLLVLASKCSTRITCLAFHFIILDLKVIYVHDLLKIVGNSVSNVQTAFISSDLLRSSLFGIT